MRLLQVLLSIVFTASIALAQNLPTEPISDSPGPDWLIDASSYSAAVYRGQEENEITLSNGLIRRTLRIAPNAATVALDDLRTNESLLRGVKPEALLTINGTEYEVGGLKGQPNYAYLLPEWIDGLTSNPGAFHYVGHEIGVPEERMPWKRVRHHAPDAVWPPRGVSLRMDYRAPESIPALKDIRVAVHYELYDGIPVMSKRITVHNAGAKSVTLNAFTSEILAAVEFGSAVDTREYIVQPPNIHVETDYAFANFNVDEANHHVVHWQPDPDYATQVNYQRLTPCLLKVSPEIGPEQTISPDETFESFHTFVMPYESTDRERNGLALKRLYRTLAPWTTENPLMMHARFADWERVKIAIDQAAEVGFEMVILTFGSGFNIEDDSEEYIAKMKQYADYAHEKGVELGGYSLLSSRSIDNANNVIMPEGETPTFGNAPCLESQWGQAYFKKLYAFYEATGFNLLEHDGSYPGDPCTATDHPGHKGYGDSRWNQYETIADFYAWCRANGIYLNVPDYYYLAGSSKCGMGYRETNWSLPRAQQVIHTRQNIHDGAWQKTPSMGWMFVPLTEYHGGGAAATIEPLHEHRDHYQAMMHGNLGMGVQACYRGPRLFDTKETKAMVSETVAWYKKYRDILESDMVHGRRADGRDIDWMLHVNPNLEHKGMLVVYNPLDQPVTRTIRPNLYYTGATATIRLREQEGFPTKYILNRDYTIELKVKIPADSFTWFVIE